MDGLLQWIAYHLPRRIVYWAAFRVWEYATRCWPEWDDPNVGTAKDALVRWER
jgi:hypothetical protein